MLPKLAATAAGVGNVAAGLPRKVCIAGVAGLVRAGNKTEAAPSTTNMIRNVLFRALKDAQLTVQDIDGFVAVPSLKEDHFMEAHYQATCMGLFSSYQRPLRCRTIDTGGAGPISALLEAERMIKNEALECVAVVAADSVGSMNSTDFLKKADDIFFKLASEHGDPVKSPAIPHGYDQITEYQMKTFGLTRDQLRMAVCLESFHAALHKDSLYHRKNPTTQYTPLQAVQEAPSVTPNISILECARRADGAACLVLASNRFLMRKNLYRSGLPTVIGGGESSGPLYPPGKIEEFTYSSCEEAMVCAFTSAGNLTHEDIDFFGLYDCFPICLVRALEACGLCSKGQGGVYIEEQYHRMLKAMENDQVESLLRDPYFFPVNTHGGLLSYGAPWEVPAMYNVIEAVHQLRGIPLGRPIPDCRRALVYGNGGILSASAVAILANSM